MDSVGTAAFRFPISPCPSQTPVVILPATAGTIRTKHLILRPLALSDADDIFEYRRLRTVADFFSSEKPHKDVEESRECIRKTIFTTPDASGAWHRQFFFAILLVDDPIEKVIGAVGVSALCPAPTLEFSTHPSTWNRGLATEAVRACVDAWWKLPRVKINPDGTATAEKLFAWSDYSNGAGRRVLEKCGFERYQDLLLSREEKSLFELKTPGIYLSKLDEDAMRLGCSLLVPF